MYKIQICIFSVIAPDINYRHGLHENNYENPRYIQEVNWSDIGHKFKLLKDHEAVL